MLDFTCWRARRSSFVYSIGSFKNKVGKPTSRFDLCLGVCLIQQPAFQKMGHALTQQEFL